MEQKKYRNVQGTMTYIFHYIYSRVVQRKRSNFTLLIFTLFLQRVVDNYRNIMEAASV